MDGHRVMSIHDAARLGDIVVAVAGTKNVVGREHFEHMKDGAMLYSRSVEIDIQALEKLASGRKPARPMVDEFTMRDGRKLFVLNRAAGDSHPAAIMDLNFANQALSAEHLLKNHTELENRVYRVPEAIDRMVAKMKLESMGIKIDRLTPEQEEYESLSGHSSQSR
jgi:adenosylhomocysteinase